jgi:putative heme-binding domain-containing protein
MTFDDRGRVITSDQHGALYRMDLAPIGADSLTPVIERLKIQNEAPVADSVIQMGFAQGLLWAFNSLYVMVNHNPEDEENKFSKSSGLYRLRDTDHDDQFDQITLLKQLEGHGEHGPHSIVLAPDGQSLYVIAGNHTDLPDMDAYRLPRVWQDDNLFPKMLDPRGHANDRAAPGGWIARIDSLGEHWEMVAGGFRNAFDVAFNPAGDLFTYDSDMEWDLGMPWYRPTRICHVPSGAEFGWRSGNAKWSPAYPDNLPAVLNIGQGSPTGVLHGATSKFPAPYRNALLAFDWSFGIIYAVHLQPDGATYSGQKEEFISGMPLPLTDGVIGPDGALYFMTGGRKLDSDLYRVYYEGEPEVVLAAAGEVDLPEAHRVRKRLESYHEAGKTGGVEAAWPYLNHPDRFMRYAARVAVEHQPVAQWQDKALSEKDPIALTQSMVALARQGDKGLKNQMLDRLCAVDYDALTDLQQVDLLRAIELTIARMGTPTGSSRQQVIAYLRPHYPADQEVLNGSLSKLLTALNDPKVIATTLALLEDDRSGATQQAEGATESADLILRNPQYGIDIANMLKNVPPAQQTYYATVLSNQRSGWTPELRERYFRWFYRAFDFEGGSSYVGFINEARKEALAHVPKGEYEHYNTLSGDSLIGNNGKNLANVPQPEGPWRRWKLEEAVAVLDSGYLEDRDFEGGHNMYLATRCATCHRMRGEGGIIGPNLTQLGTRFTAEDMMTAIVEPNEVISDQYASTVLYLANGQSVVGKLIREDETTYYLSQNPFAPDVIREVPKAEVTEKKLSAVSVMPPGLINPLNEEELRDLIAYLMAGGDPEHPIYEGE